MLHVAVAVISYIAHANSLSLHSHSHCTVHSHSHAHKHTHMPQQRQRRLLLLLAGISQWRSVSVLLFDGESTLPWYNAQHTRIHMRMCRNSRCVASLFPHHGIECITLCVPQQKFQNHRTKTNVLVIEETRGSRENAWRGRANIQEAKMKEPYGNAHQKQNTQYYTRTPLQA